MSEYMKACMYVYMYTYMPATYIRLHYIKLHCNTLHCIAVHDMPTCIRTYVHAYMHILYIHGTMMCTQVSDAVQKNRIAQQSVAGRLWI